MPKPHRFVVPSLALVFLAGAANASDRCATAITALGGIGPELQCVQTPLGVGLAPTHQRADDLSRLGQAAETRFRRHFGRDASPYAIVEITDPQVLKAQQAALQAAGFGRTLPWFSREAYVAQQQIALRRSAESRVRASGGSEEAARAAGDTLLAQASGRFSSYALSASEAAVVPHEIGHGLYVEAFWPSYVVEATGHYGGPGPDWLDEVAPLLLESGDSAEARRRQFQDIYQGRASGLLAGYPLEKLIDLPTFLDRPHPARALAASGNASSGTGEPVVRVLSGESDPSQMAAVVESTVYYLQGRLFADFLIDRSGDPGIFASVAEAFARDETFDAWLSANGPGKGLGGDRSALNTQWQAWLKVRFGAS